MRIRIRQCFLRSNGARWVSRAFSRNSSGMIHARSLRVFVGVFFAKQGRSMLRPYEAIDQVLAGGGYELVLA